ncbi:MAG: DUF2939 domain-containing protein [Candidatus Binataceae bacterium]|nr:DUF2939 domain-containing protein [Candidatus Binataceae bacterium]
MGRFAIRHWTAILVISVVAAWAIFYLPGTPSYAVYQMKHAIDARDGATAATYVNFPSVVRNAGYEMVQQRTDAGNVLEQMVGKGAVDMFAQPVAAMVDTWTQRQVDNGAKNVQMPGWAVLASIAMIHRNGDNAYTHFTDPRGRVWDVRMKRDSVSGRWQVIEIKHIEQMIQQLESENGGARAIVPPPP